jgi:aryl-alcohol dehydrogenase-like predicted oxidoreductase
MAAGQLTKSGGPLDKLAKSHQATTAQIALAWLLHRSPVTLPIPGTSSVKHLEENVAAAELQLKDEEWRSLERDSTRAA